MSGDDRVQMISKIDVGSLRRKVEGQVMLPGDAGYDSARALWNAMVDRRPAVAVRCVSSVDVAAAVDFARRNDLEIGVRCGGHSVLGISVPDGGLLIDLSGLRAVRVDPDARGHGFRAVRCSVIWIGRPRRTAWPRRRAMSLTPASVG
jgi:hypothetical protein